MPHVFRRASVLCAALAFLATSALPAAAAPKPVVTVFAAASLREAFEGAAPEFTRRTGYPVRFNFGGSDTLAAQLQQGAPADVFASANMQQMTRVTTLVDDAKVFARNRLVVIAPATSSVHAVSDLANSGTKVVLAAASVPVGTYGRAALANLDKVSGYPPDFDKRVFANVVSEETDVKAVATKVALAEADAGIVYATDVTPQVAAKVRVLRFPPDVAPDASYPIATVKAASNADGGRAFVAFITSPAGATYLRARGFE